MELSSPENGFEELNNILKENEPCLADELDPSYIVNKEKPAGDYACGNLASNNSFCGEHEHDSLSKDFSYYNFCASPQQMFSPLQTGYDDNVVLSEAQFIGDEGRLLSSPKEYYQQGEAEHLCSDYLSRSLFQVELETVQYKAEAEVSGPIMESFSKKDVIEEQEMEDRVASPSHERTVHESFFGMSTYESTKSGLENGEVEEEVSDMPAEKLHFSVTSPIENDETENEHIHNVKNSPADPRNPKMLHIDQLSPNRSPQVSKSPDQARQMSFTHDISPSAYLSPASPKTAASPQSVHELPYSSKLHRPEHPSSSEEPDHLIPPYDNKNHASPRRSHQGACYVHNASARQLSASPRNHHSHQNHRRQKRSVSKSPNRRKEPSSRHRAEYHERSRSRSPHRRHYHRRSPRRRYSPSHRSRHRSPKRRHWSPPHNRSTGLGKPGRNLFVAGFSFLTTERDLERKFSRFGRVRDVRIVRNKRSGESRGFGFLSLEHGEEADAAIRALDKTEWNGRIILVEKSKPH